jgi:hypothetical protein
MVGATGNVSFNDFGYYNETDDYLRTTFTTILIVLKYKKNHINILKIVSLVVAEVIHSREKSHWHIMMFYFWMNCLSLN